MNVEMLLPNQKPLLLSGFLLFLTESEKPDGFPAKNCPE